MFREPAFSEAPAFLRPLSHSIPLSYGTDNLNILINGHGHIWLSMSFPIFMGFSIVLFDASTRNVKRKQIY